MKLRKEEERYLRQVLDAYLTTPVVQKMKHFSQHGTTSTFDHCYAVCQTCLWINRRIRLHAKETIMLRAAFLHDFYLYDWHHPDPSHRWHGFTHANLASNNAKRYFALGESEREIIRCHMWPLNITRIPQSREAWLVCLADKICCVREFFQGKAGACQCI